MKKLYCALLGMVLSISINAVSATTVEAESPFVRAVRASGGVVDRIVDTRCCAGWCGPKTREVIRSLPTGIAVVGGHLGGLLDGARDGIKASQDVLRNNERFVRSVLDRAKAAGIDVKSAETAWKLALKTGNQATLFVGTDAVFNFFSNPKTEGIDSTFSPIRSLLTEADANYLWFLGSYASILMPDDYSAAPGLTRAQNAVLFTMEAIKFFKEPGVATISSIDGGKTVLAKRTATLTLKNNSTAIPEAVNILTAAGRLGQLIGDLATGALTLSQLDRLVPTLKTTPTFYVAG